MNLVRHYNDVIIGAIPSPITSLTIVYKTIYSDADQGKHQSSASLASVRGIQRGPMNSLHKWPVTRKMFPFNDVIMELRSSILLTFPRLRHKVCQVLFKKTKIDGSNQCLIVYITWCLIPICPNGNIIRPGCPLMAALYSFAIAMFISISAFYQKLLSLSNCNYRLSVFVPSISYCGKYHLGYIGVEKWYLVRIIAIIDKLGSNHIAKTLKVQCECDICLISTEIAYESVTVL